MKDIEELLNQMIALLNGFEKVSIRLVDNQIIAEWTWNDSYTLL